MMLLIRLNQCQNVFVVSIVFIFVVSDFTNGNSLNFVGASWNSTMHSVNDYVDSIFHIPLFIVVG